FMLRRVSPVTLAAIAVGAWGVGQLAKAVPVTAEPAAPPASPRAPIVTPPPLAWSAAADGF
ncbi:hypothetical protein, partial [Sandarakinorhabdus oryzae]|uniref:hypothetical protein n=1 Tax=Sandarakinorhabdus oryzae TaxID=2675220 RepID=UPI001A9CA9CD